LSRTKAVNTNIHLKVIDIKETIDATSKALFFEYFEVPMIYAEAVLLLLLLLLLLLFILVVVVVVFLLDEEDTDIYTD
jgi:hypothetical protein